VANKKQGPQKQNTKKQQEYQHASTEIEGGNGNAIRMKGRCGC